METPIPMPLPIITFAILVFLSGAQSVTFTFTNKCPYRVWPATLTGAGPQLSSTGFVLRSGSSYSLDAPSSWSGRFWARTHCSKDSSGRFACATGDCASGSIECNGAGGIPPASWVEFTLSGYGGLDYYDISLVDGFNAPVSITPQGGATASCKITSCAADLNAACWSGLAVKGGSHGRRSIACKSACLAFNQPQFCCTGEYGTPDKCPPSKYSMMFKRRCPQAYSYAYDDKTSTFTCPTGANYLITFCP